MYCLEAVIARAPVLQELANRTHEVRIAPLGQHLSLMPMTDALFDAVTVLGAAELDGFWKAPAGFGTMLAACSVIGPVAYIEADFFGGQGSQSAQVWNGGNVIFGPLQTGIGEPFPVAGSPISQALRHLGVVAGDHGDEFDAIGLGRHRRTDDWY